MRALALLTAIALVPCTVPVAPVIAQTTARFDQLRDEGAAYYKRDLLKQAFSKLNQAYAAPGGKDDYTTCYLRAQVAYKLQEIEIAVQMVNEAGKLADTDRRKRTIHELRAEITGLYGGVRFEAEEGETNKTGRIFFEAKTGIINPEKKQLFGSIRDRFRNSNITLPAEVYLPYGEYTANNVPFSIVQGAQTPPVKIFLQVPKEEPVEDDSEIWWYVGIGGGAALLAGLGVGAFFLFSDDEPAKTKVYPARIEF